MELKDKIAYWYQCGLWTEAMVRKAVPNIMSQEEANAIIQTK